MRVGAFGKLPHMNAPQAFAQTLKALREGQKLSQEKLAEKAGLSMRTISLIECDKLLPTIATIEALAKALELRISEMMVVMEKQLEE